jgi:hypothetical protein
MSWITKEKAEHPETLRRAQRDVKRYYPRRHPAPRVTEVEGRAALVVEVRTDALTPAQTMRLAKAIGVIYLNDAQESVADTVPSSFWRGYHRRILARGSN